MKIWNFQGPFLQILYREDSQFGIKSPSFRGATFARVQFPPSPLDFSTTQLGRADQEHVVLMLVFHLGAGVLHKFVADFVLWLFLAFIFQRDGIFTQTLGV